MKLNIKNKVLSEILTSSEQGSFLIKGVQLVRLTRCVLLAFLLCTDGEGMAV